MLPIAPMMIEHRLIERMIRVMKEEVERIKKNSEPNVLFIDLAVDFIRTYADQTHHGKEEDILFRELKMKQLKPEDKKIMDDLIQEHIKARATTKALVEAKEKYLKGDKLALKDLIEKMEFLAGFYPVHIEKEDKHFFIPIMKYFTKVEQDAQLEEGRVYDRKMIHKKYEKAVVAEETQHNLTDTTMKKNWLDFL